MPITSPVRPRGRSSTTATTANANALVRASKRACVTNLPFYSAFRTPHSALDRSAIRNPQLQSPILYILPLLQGALPELPVQIRPHQLQHRFHFLRGGAGVERAAQVRVQLLGGAEHRDGRHGGQFPPLQVEPRAADHLAV